MYLVWCYVKTAKTIIIFTNLSMSKQELSESELFFDMSRLNRKRLKQREEKDILEGIFLGNATCTSIEIKEKYQEK